MLPRCRLFPWLISLLFFALGPVLSLGEQAHSAAALPASLLVLDGLGKGTAPLGGRWQFREGDNPAWADPSFDDYFWAQITADKPWGLQNHANYAGFAWYRRHITISPAPGASPDVALLIPAVDEVYEIYWNGVLVGHLGRMPPHWVAYSP